MKTLLLMICPWLLTTGALSSCTAFNQPTAKTTTVQDGVTSVTEVPVLAPKDAAFQQMCQAVLSSTFIHPQ